jgi:hypothetical protein
MGPDNWSSPVVIPGVTEPAPNGPYRETPSVTFNTHLNTYVMMCRGKDGGSDFAFFLHLPLNDALTKWSQGLRIDVSNEIPALFPNINLQYPYLINNDSTGGNKGSLRKAGGIIFFILIEF